MSDSTRQALTESFNKMDKDKSGFIDASEVEDSMNEYLKHPYCSASYKATFSDPVKRKEAVDEFMKQMDKSGDKKVSLQEYLDYFGQK